MYSNHAKNKLKYTTLICLSVCLLPLPAQAQRGAWNSIPKVFKRIRQTICQTCAPKTNLVKASRNFDTLDKRIDRTVQQALQAQQGTEHISLSRGPIRKTQRRGPFAPLFSARRMYPDKPFLQNPILGSWLAESYFVAQSNRLLAQHIHETKASFWPAFEAAKPRFIKEANALKQPKNLLNWTAGQIPVQTTDLFIGELHGLHEIPQFISQLLPLIRQQNPNRKIFLFSEFLWDLQGKETPLEEKIITLPHGHYYAEIWKTAEQLDISLVRLEAEYRLWNQVFSITDTEGNALREIPAGATPEGIRLRNEHWWGILEKYRQENPDALFIVYTGKAHSLYNYPFSLAKRLPKETTWMLDLTVEPSDLTSVLSRYSSVLEYLDEDLYFPQPVLKWSSPDLAELSGFDVHVRLPGIPKSSQLIEADKAQLEKFNQQYRKKRIK